MLVAGCHRTMPQLSLADSPFDVDRPLTYELYPGDELQLRFPTNPDLDQKVTIRTDGMISLPHIGDIQAAQRSPEEVATEAAGRLVGILQKPEVTVIVLEEAGRRMYVGGEVQRPGAIALHPNQTLAQAVFEAGGFLETANKEEVLVLRHRLGEATYVLKANIENILTGREADVRLEPCDIIYVPQTAIAKVGRFVELYINRIIPRAFSFPFITELYTRPVRVVDSASSVPPITITR